MPSTLLPGRPQAHLRGRVPRRAGARRRRLRLPRQAAEADADDGVGVAAGRRGRPRHGLRRPGKCSTVPSLISNRFNVAICRIYNFISIFISIQCFPLFVATDIVTNCLL